MNDSADITNFTVIGNPLDNGNFHIESWKTTNYVEEFVRLLFKGVIIAHHYYMADISGLLILRFFCLLELNN